jgi:hypothetical protein
MRADGHTGCSQSPDTVPVRQGGLSRSQVIQLRPAPHCRTPILSYSLDVTPAGHILNWQLDPHNNHLARLLFPDKTNEFLVEVDLVAELSPFNPFDFFWNRESKNTLSHTRRSWPRISNPIDRSIRPALCSRRFLRVSWEKSGTISFLLDLNRKVRNEIGYVTRLDPGVQTCEQTLESARGRAATRHGCWCRFSEILGIAARFVSGYLIQLAGGRERSGGSERSANRLRGFACLGRSVPAGRGLDWDGSDLGPARRRGSHPAGLHPERFARPRPSGHGRAGQRGVQLLHVDSPLE